MLQARNGVDKLQLHILGQGRGKPLKIHFLRFKPARLNEKLVAFLVCKANYFILKAGAIARAFALDFAAIHRRAVKVIQNNPFGFLVCVGAIAAHLVLRRLFRFKAEGHGFIIALLNRCFGKINAAPVYPARGACFKTAKRNIKRIKRF